MLRLLYILLLLTESPVFAQGPLLPTLKNQMLNQIASDYKLVGIILDASSHSKSIAVVRKVSDLKTFQLQEGSRIEQATIQKIAKGSLVIAIEGQLKNIGFDVSNDEAPAADKQVAEIPKSDEHEKSAEVAWDDSTLEKINVEKIFKISDLSGEESGKIDRTQEDEYSPEAL